MKTKISTILIAFLLGCIVCFTTCKKNSGCPDATNTYYNLSADEKSKIPYSGTDTLIFLSNTGDSAKLFGHGKTDNYNTQSYWQATPDCPQTTTNCEIISTTYIGSNIGFSNIKFIPENLCEPPAIVSISINGIKFQDYLLLQLSDSSNYHDTTIINSKLYHGIKIFSLNANITIDSTNYIIYNYPSGIVKVKFSNNQTWLKQ